MSRAWPILLLFSTSALGARDRIAAIRNLLSRLRDALDPLTEIARWDIDHAFAARMILGLIAGISDLELFKVVNEDPGQILGMLATPPASKP
jgi:hypothetical protein